MLHYTDTRIAKFNRRRDIYDWKAENLTDGVKPFAGVQPGLYLGELPGEPFRLPRPQLGFLPGFIRDLFPNQEQLVHIVRKMAHFTEFACLGGLSCGLLAAARTVKLHPFFHVWAGGFFVAAIDETIQIFTGRGSQLQDVWLDFAGFSAGLLAVLLVRALVLRSKPEESPKEVDNVIAFPKDHDAFKHLHSSGKS